MPPSQDALAALKGNEDLLDNLNMIFLVDEGGPAGRRSSSGAPFSGVGRLQLRDLATESMTHVSVDERQDRVTELFDKYNLLTLPVVDEEGKLAGVITADDMISVLRQK